MKTKIYNKLVRDNIPKIITANRQKASIKILSPPEYFKALKQKLLEEVEEFNESETAEELADILEVIRALTDQIGSNIHQIEVIRSKKYAERGGFEKRLLLESVTSN